MGGENPQGDFGSHVTHVVAGKARGETMVSWFDG